MYDAMYERKHRRLADVRVLQDRLETYQLSRHTRQGRILRIVLVLPACLLTQGRVSSEIETPSKPDHIPYEARTLLIRLRHEVDAAGGKSSSVIRSPNDFAVTDSLKRLMSKYGVKRVSPFSLKLETAGQGPPVSPLSSIYTLDLGPGVSVTAAATAFAMDPGVQWAEPNYFVSKDTAPNDPLFSNQWAL